MWKDLTLQQKAEIMKMSVANGVTDINDIRALYDGQVRHEFKGGGYKSSQSIRKRISDWEGSSMYAPAPDTGKVNRPFSAEERDFWRVIPNDIKPHLTQEMTDALFSTSYNIGAGNFKKRVVPNLIKVFRDGTGTLEDITNSMYGTRDKEPKMKGLRTRRATERNLFATAFNKQYGNPTISAYHKMYGKPDLSISNDILYNPAQELVWQPVEEQKTPNPIQQYSDYLINNYANMTLPQVKVAPTTPIEERVQIPNSLPDITPFLSYLPDQQEGTPRRVATPTYEAPIIDFNQPYVLFGR